ncbi:MAG: sensor histidine kinase [Spirosoma sp.]|nr:sensor histidine kinase [Spirosoma sp.]
MRVLRWLLCWKWGLLLSVAPIFAGAQPPLPLQPHKIKIAQMYYREGVANHDSMRIAEAFYEYGKLYTAATDYHTATRWFIKSMRIIEKRGDSYELARLHVRLADLAALQVQYTTSRDHAYQALAIARRCRSERGMIRACAVLARLHHRNWHAEAPANTQWPAARPDSGLYYLRQVERLAYRLNDPMEVAQVKQALGGRLAAHHDRRAIAYLTDALAIATRQNSGDRLGMMLNLASAYLTFGQPRPAFNHIRRAKLIADSAYANVYAIQYAVTYHLANYYRATGQWKQALTLTDTLRQWEKRDLIADRNGAISRLSIEYESEKKEARLKSQQEELALQVANQRIQQWFLWAMLASLVGAVGMSVVFFWLYRKNRRISRRNAKLVREQNHRVKNNLQVVASLLSLQANRLTDNTAQQAVEESQYRVQAMATLHRRLYDGEHLASVYLPDYLTELVEDVLVAFGYPYLQPELDIAPITLSADEALPLGLILNELTTNACKYAFPGHPDPIFRVSCQQKGNQLQLDVADNGPGLEGPGLEGPAEPRLKNADSFGMRLIQLEADQLRGSHQFTVADGTRFTLTFTRRKQDGSTKYPDRRG